MSSPVTAPPPGSDSAAPPRRPGRAIAALLVTAGGLTLALRLTSRMSGAGTPVLLAAVAGAACLGGPLAGLLAAVAATVGEALWISPGGEPLAVGIFAAVALLIAVLAAPRGGAAGARPKAPAAAERETSDPAWSPVALNDPATALETEQLARRIPPTLDDRLAADRARGGDEAHFRSLLRDPAIAVWRFHHDRPVDTALSVEEQVEQLYQVSYLAECNDATARMYGFPVASDIIGTRLAVFLSPSDPANIAYLRTFIRSGYRLENAESHEVDRHGDEKYFLNDLVGIVNGGFLLGAWGTQRDVTAERRRPTT